MSADTRCMELYLDAEGVEVTGAQPAPLRRTPLVIR